MLNALHTGDSSLQQGGELAGILDAATVLAFCRNLGTAYHTQGSVKTLPYAASSRSPLELGGLTPLPYFPRFLDP